MATAATPRPATPKAAQSSARPGRGAGRSMPSPDPRPAPRADAWFAQVQGARRGQLKRPVTILLELTTGYEVDTYGSLIHRARRNGLLFEQLDEAIRTHALPPSPALEPLGALLRVLMTSTGPAFQDAPVTAVPMLI